MIKEKNGKRYLVVGSRAIEVDKNGKPKDKPKITKTKDKEGKDVVTVEIPSFKLITKTN